MEVRIYELAPDGAWIHRGWLQGATEAQATSRHTSPGWWTLTVPVGAKRTDALREGMFVRLDGSYWGIVEDIDAPRSAAGSYVTVSGCDVKGLVSRRVIYPTADGYAAYKGTSEAVMLALARDNLGEGASEVRRVPGLRLAPDGGRGIADDRWRSRYDSLADALGEIASAAGLGYDIVPDLAGGGLVFTVLAGADRTQGQSERPRIVLDVARRTLVSSEYGHGTSESRNLIYATEAGWEYAEESFTQSYILGDTEPTGLARREMAAEYSLSGVEEAEKFDELRRLAKAGLKQYEAAESLTGAIPSGGIYTFGRDFVLGDRVTLLDSLNGVRMDAPITEVTRTWRSEGVTTSLVFGEAAPTVFGRLKRQIKGGW